MAGIVGCYWPGTAQVGKDAAGERLTRQIAALRRPRDRSSAAVSEHVALGWVGQAFRAGSPSLATDERTGCTVVVDGEIYDVAALTGRFLPGADSTLPTAELVLALFRAAGWSWLASANGQFSIALHDPRHQTLFLATDRYGHRPILVHQGREALTFAPELKGLLASGTLPLAIDPGAVEEFLCFGYLVGERTWLREVELVPPGTLVTVSPKGISRERYWSWDRLTRADSPPGFDDAAVELGRLWRQAIARRTDEERVGVLLSGGLDSRSVLGVLAGGKPPIHAVTFGMPGCDDQQIAASAASVAGATHHFYPIDADNWQAGREDAVWWTEGQLSYRDLHSVVVLDELPGLFDVNMHSFAGDLILGGSYLSRLMAGAAPATVTGAIHRRMRRTNRLFPEDHLLARISELASSYPTTDSFFLDSRVRRFTLQGCMLLETSVFDRKPTFDNDLLEFCYSLPDEYRLNSRLYAAMLLRELPELYQSIPWQRSGLPISASATRRRVRSTTRRFRTGAPRNHEFHDYAAWTRTPGFRGLLASRLLAANACWRDHLAADRAERLVRDHLAGDPAADTDGVLLLWTLELWLAQLRDADRGVRASGA